jgi:hypothetical protein
MAKYFLAFFKNICKLFLFNFLEYVKYLLLFKRPEKIDWNQVNRQNNKQNLQLAFNLAESEFSVTKLLDVEDVDVSVPDEKSLITYVSSLFEALPNIKLNTSLNEKDKVFIKSFKKYLILN